VDSPASLMDPRSDASLIFDVRDVPLSDLATRGTAWQDVAADLVARVADGADSSPGLPTTMSFNSAI
jgi:hypothetical protein